MILSKREHDFFWPNVFLQNKYYILQEICNVVKSRAPEKKQKTSKNRNTKDRRHKNQPKKNKQTQKDNNKAIKFDEKENFI